MVPEKNGPREKWCPEKWSPKNWSPEKWSPENWSPEKWSPENWSPEKCPSKIVLRQNNDGKFKRLFHFYQLIPLLIQKDVWRLRHDPTYALNSRTLRDSKKICCRVLGFHRLITSEHSTHTPRCSTVTPQFFLFWVSLVPIFPRTIFPMTIFRGPFFRDSFFSSHLIFAKMHRCHIFDLKLRWEM